MSSLVSHQVHAQAIIDAVKKGDTTRVRQLIAANAQQSITDVDGVGNTALQWAAEQGRTEISQILLQYGANVNSRGDGGATPLLHAARNQHLDTIDLLMSKGADVDAADNTGRTPLHEAAIHNRAGSITYLVMYGANIEARNGDGDTAISLAALNGQADVCKLLIGVGANVRSKNNSGKTAIDEALQRGKNDIADLMSNYDAEMQLRADTAERRLDDSQGIRTSFANWGDPRAVTKAVYKQDFARDEVGPEWSTSPQPGAGRAPLRVSTTPKGQRRFLGDFGSQAVHLNLTNLPAHREVAVKFNLFIIDSWDGNDFRFGPDIWRLSVEDGPTLLNTTFANTYEARRAVYSPDQVKNIKVQAYPDEYPGGHNPIYSGADEFNSLGYMFVLNSKPIAMDAVYTIRYTFRHSFSDIRLNFAAHGLEPLDNENWGIANVEVCVDSIPPVIAPVAASKPKPVVSRSPVVHTSTRAAHKTAASKRKPSAKKASSAKSTAASRLHDKKKALTP